jgi:hypothetical protein
MAYAMAISPITVLLGIIPYLGAILGLAWYLYLMVAASAEVHKIVQKTALIVFGIIFILLAIPTTCGILQRERHRKALKNMRR